MKTNRSVIHNGYTVIQSSYNNHVSIYTEDGRCIMHAPVTKKKTDDELKDMVGFYLTMRKKLIKNKRRTI